MKFLISSLSTLVHNIFSCREPRQCMSVISVIVHSKCTKDSIILQSHCNGVSQVAQSVQWLAMDWGTGVQYPMEVEDFSSTLCIQLGLGRTQPPVQWVPGIIPGRKYNQCVLLTTHPFLVPWVKKERVYPSATPMCQNWHVKVTSTFFFLLQWYLAP
jgi:hypothetical protein